MKKVIIITLIIFLLTFLVNAQSCTVDSECADGEICEGGECRSESLIDTIKTELPAFYCAIFPADCAGEPECTDNADCSDGYECSNEVCEPIVTGNGNGNGAGNGGNGAGNGGGFYDDDYYGSPCLEQWDCTPYTACVSGQKTRTCTDTLDCGTEYFKPAESYRCDPSGPASCNDGKLNQGEEEPDCGGPCPPCATCYDNKENCHTTGGCEDGLDCGGPCAPCKHALSIILVIITAIIIIVLIIGIWYWRMKKTGEIVGDTVKEFKPPTQPSSMLRI